MTTASPPAVPPRNASHRDEHPYNTAYMKHHAVKAKYLHKPAVAEYDARRFMSPSGRWRNRLKIAAIRRALASIETPSLVLDVPCGTGRLFGLLSSSAVPYVGCDISTRMLDYAAARCDGAAFRGLVAADAESLPFADNSFDAVLCIRFLFHLSPELRVRVLRELARVSSRYLILDYRLRYASLKNLSHVLRAALGAKLPLKRPTRRQMLAELASAGLTPLASFRVTPFFSDKHIILCRKSPAA